MGRSFGVCPPEKKNEKQNKPGGFFLVGWKYGHMECMIFHPSFQIFFCKIKGVPLDPFQKALEIGAQVVVAKKFDQMDIW